MPLNISDEEREFAAALLQQYTLQFNDLNAYSDAIHWGIYTNALPLVKRGPLDKEGYYPPEEFDVGNGAAKIALKYKVAFDPTPIVPTIERDEEGAETDWTFEAANFPKVISPSKSWPLYSARRVADLTVDSKEEMEACAFRYSQNVGDLSKSTRRSYELPLHDINEIPWKTGFQTGNTGQLKKFLEECSLRATYDSVTGEYYPKYADATRTQYGSRFEELHAEYLSRNLHEFELAQGSFYVLYLDVMGKDSYELLGVWQLSADTKKKGQLKRTPVPLRKFQEPKERRKRVAVFFYAAAGPKKHQAGTFTPFEVKKPRLSGFLVDPEKMLEETLLKVGKVELKKSDLDSLYLKEPFDWFAEMLAAFFPAEFYFFSIKELKPYGDGFSGLQSAKGVLDAKIKELLATLDLKAPGAKELKQSVEKIIKDPDVICIPQGYQTGGTSMFVGEHNGECYVHDTEDHTTYVVGTNVLIKGISDGYIFARVYENTKGMLPFIKIVVWGSVIVMGGAALGVSAAGAYTAARQVVVKYGRKWVADTLSAPIKKRLMREMVKLLAPAVVGMLAKLASYLSGSDDAKRYRKFCDGFLNGYCYQTLYNVFYGHLVNAIVNGPAPIRYYKAYKRAMALIDKVDHVVDELKGKIDADAAKQAGKQIVEAGKNLIQGVAVVVNALHWLDATEGKPILGAVTEHDGEEEPMSAAEWDRQRITTLAATWEKSANELIALIEKEGKSTMATVDGVLGFLTDKRVRVVGGVVVVALGVGWNYFKGKGLNVSKQQEKKNKKKAEKSKTRKVAKYSLLLAVVGFGIWDQIENDGEIRKEIWDFLWDDFPPKDEERAYLYGQMFGNLLGGVMVDGPLLDRKSGIANALGTAKLNSFWKGELKHGFIGPAITLLFRRYIAMAKELFGAGGTVEQLWGDLLKALDTADPVQRKASKFRGATTPGVTLFSVIKVLARADKVLADENKRVVAKIFTDKYSGDFARYKDDLTSLKRRLDKTGLSKLAEKEIDKAREVVKSLEKEFNHLMVMQFLQELQVAVKAILEALDQLFTPVNGKKDTSVMEILEVLGVDVGSDQELKALDSYFKERGKQFQV